MLKRKNVKIKGLDHLSIMQKGGWQAANGRYGGHKARKGKGGQLVCQRYFTSKIAACKTSFGTMFVPTG